MTAAAEVGDVVLAEAAAAAASAGQTGQVTQYLAGVPELLRRCYGPGGDPYGQAVLTAAMGASRLGHVSPLPANLLQEAVVGYLTDPHRTKEIASWRHAALAWAGEELKGAVPALRPVPPAAGTGVAGYRVADYLDQHSRRARQDQLGPASLWDALTAHAATASDLARLGQAARDRGLYRCAAALWTTAVSLGSAYAASRLVVHLRLVSRADTMSGARWCAGRASLDDPRAVGDLLRALRWAEAGDAVRILLDRDPAAQVSLHGPGDVIKLLRELRAAEASSAVHTLTSRAAAEASLDDTYGATQLLSALCEADDDDAVSALAVQTVAHAGLDDPRAVAYLLPELRQAGASDAVGTLLDRDPAAQVSLDNPLYVAELLQGLREAGASGAAQSLSS
jgi:hypothetical protein